MELLTYLFIAFQLVFGGTLTEISKEIEYHRSPPRMIVDPPVSAGKHPQKHPAPTADTPPDQFPKGKK